jgi:hypothetical protein
VIGNFFFIYFKKLNFMKAAVDIYLIRLSVSTNCIFLFHLFLYSCSTEVGETSQVVFPLKTPKTFLGQSREDIHLKHLQIITLVIMISSLCEFICSALLQLTKWYRVFVEN